MRGVLCRECGIEKEYDRQKIDKQQIDPADYGQGREILRDFGKRVMFSWRNGRENPVEYRKKEQGTNCAYRIA